MKMRYSIYFTLLMLPLCLQSIEIDGFSTETNDRFANDPAFIANAFNLSGVAFNGRWLTMLSPNVYISATHFSPGVGSSVTFYASNDPEGPRVDRTVSSTKQQIGDTDLILGTLDTYLPLGEYTYYDFATETISDTGPPSSRFTGSPYYEANAYVFGRSPTTWTTTSQNMAVGRNLLDRFWFNTTPQNSNETGDAIGANVDDPGDPNYVDFEAALQSGDSGAPLFVENGNGGLTLVGVNWFISGTDFFGATYVGNYNEEIEQFLQTYTIPEPETYALILGFLSVLLIAWRRKRIR